MRTADPEYIQAYLTEAVAALTAFQLDTAYQLSSSLAI